MLNLLCPGPVKVKQLICIIHEDGVSTEVKCGLKSLIHMSRTHIDMLEDGKISIVHKKNSGKILCEVSVLVYILERAFPIIARSGIVYGSWQL